MASRGPLSNKQLQDLLENDSESDSNDDPGDFVASPSNTYLEMSDDDLIEQRLDRLFEGSFEHEHETNIPEVNNEVVLDDADTSRYNVLSMDAASAGVTERDEEVMDIAFTVPSNEAVVNGSCRPEMNNTDKTADNMTTLNQTYTRPLRKYED